MPKIYSADNSNSSNHRHTDPQQQQQPTKRVKVTLACTICRKKKVKCDGVQPTCSRCDSVGIDCQYSDPPKKRGPPKGYVEVITNRAHRIETLLSAGHGHYYQQQHPDQHHDQRQRYDPQGSKQKQHPVAAAVKDDVVTSDNHSIRHLTFAVKNTEQQHRKRQYHPYQRPMNLLLLSIAEKVQTVLSSEQQQHHLLQYENLHDSNGFLYEFLTFDASGSSNHQSQPSPHFSNVTFTTTAAAAFLQQQQEAVWTENFFNYFNLLFPLLSKPHYMYQLTKQEVNPILKLAVCILGCRFDSTNNHHHGLNDNDKNNNDNQQEAWLYTQFFNDYGPILFSSSTSHDISTVQAVIIMCWSTYLAGDMHKCYSLRQLLAVIVNELQLGYESSSCLSPHPQDAFHTEMKRRAFWVAYVMDQWLSASHLAPSIISTVPLDGSQFMLVGQTDKKWNCKYPQLEDSQLFALFPFNEDQHPQQQNGLMSERMNSSGSSSSHSSHHRRCSTSNSGHSHHDGSNTIPSSSSSSLLSASSASTSTSLPVESAFQVNSFIEMIRLCKIIHQFLSPMTCSLSNDTPEEDAVSHRLETKLTEWLLNLPSYLDYGKMTHCKQDPQASPSPIARVYRILYYTVQIMLNNSKNDVCDDGQEEFHERRTMKKNGGLSNSICTTAANTIVHISEQMVDAQQEKYLYNVFFFSLILSASVHLSDNTTVPSSASSANKIHLYKTSSLLKRVNCSLLPSLTLDQLVDTFLLEGGSMAMDDGPSKGHLSRRHTYQHQRQQQPSPTHSSSSFTSATTMPTINSKKRVYRLTDDDMKVEDWLLDDTYSFYHKSSHPIPSSAHVMAPTNTITTSHSSSNSSCSPPSTPPSFHSIDYHYDALSATALSFRNSSSLPPVHHVPSGVPISQLEQQQPLLDPTAYCSGPLCAPPPPPPPPPQQQQEQQQQLPLNTHHTDTNFNYNANHSIYWSTQDWANLMDINMAATNTNSVTTTRATTITNSSTPVVTTTMCSPIPYYFTPSPYSSLSSSGSFPTAIVALPSAPLDKERKAFVTNPIAEFDPLQAQQPFFPI